MVMQGTLEILFTYMNAKGTHYFLGQSKTTKFYLKVERKRRKTSTSNLSYGVKTRSSDKTELVSGTDEKDGTDEKHGTSLVKPSKKRHYAQDVRIPDYIVREKSATGVFIGTPQDTSTNPPVRSLLR